MMKFNSSLSLGVKFVCLVVVVVSITLTLSSYFSITYNSENRAHYFDLKSELLAEVISVVAPESIYSFDYTVLNKYIENISQREDVIFVAMRDIQGRYITDYYNENNLMVTSSMIKAGTTKFIEAIPILKKMDHLRVVNHPISHEGKSLGEVELIISTINVDNDLKKIIQFQLLMSLVAIGFLSLVIYFIFRNFALNRINRLTLSAEKVGQGDFNEIIYDNSNDEIGKLGKSFSEMIDSLKSNKSVKEQAIREVNDLNKTLESKVDERTRELNSKNHELSLQRLELENHRDHLQDLVDEKTESLVKEKNNAESANLAKSEFLANMSHELRTPMHAILSFSRFGIKKFDSLPAEKMLAYFQKIETSGNRLLSLLNNLLDLSKLESGKQDLDRKPFLLSSITNEVVAEFDRIISEKNVFVQVENRENEKKIFADKEKIGQVVRNLLSNAIKFTEENKNICIRICDEDDYIRFEIEDEGMGIPENELDQVFDKFIQSSKTKTGAGGTGLGLPISKEIILLHKGEIAAEMTKTSGALFWFTLKQFRDKNG